MVLVRCTGCRRRPQAKFTAVYAAYFTEAGERVAYKLRLCDSCLQEHIAPFSRELEPDEPLRCPSCGIGTEDDYMAIYAGVYIPGCDRFDVEMPFCASCQLIMRQWIVDHGEALEDRRRAEIGPSTHPSGLEVLRSMGIQPRVR